MAEPIDPKLYEQAKTLVDKSYDKPSAYRSMAYSRFYLRAFREKYGENKPAYKGRLAGDLKNYVREKWIDVRSYIDTPEDPKPCGSINYGKDEYAFCLPITKVSKYSNEELIALLNRKAEIGKSRLVVEPFLRDLGISKEKVLKLKPVREHHAKAKVFVREPVKKLVEEPTVKESKIELRKPDIKDLNMSF